MPATRTNQEPFPPETVHRSLKTADLATKLAALVEREHQIRWEQGDVILEMMEGGESPMYAYRTAAGIMGKSIRWAVELAKVARAYRGMVRTMSNNWHLYRVAANTRHPNRWLRYAITNRLQPKELKLAIDRQKQTSSQHPSSNGGNNDGGSSDDE